ncbi:MAG TPA: hypothetical protein DCS80_06125 [Betaproteobacteria bacterium]|nr:hypothetical protein [Betaproteobacteria bacterium]
MDPYKRFRGKTVQSLKYEKSKLVISRERLTKELQLSEVERTAAKEAINSQHLWFNDPRLQQKKLSSAETKQIEIYDNERLELAISEKDDLIWQLAQVDYQMHLVNTSITRAQVNSHGHQICKMAEEIFEHKSKESDLRVSLKKKIAMAINLGKNAAEWDNDIFLYFDTEDKTAGLFERFRQEKLRVDGGQVTKAEAFKSVLSSSFLKDFSEMEDRWRFPERFEQFGEDAQWIAANDDDFD